MRYLWRLLAVVVIGLLTISSYAQSDLERIRFAPGETSAQITGIVSQAQVDRYVFRAFEGQTVFFNAGKDVTVNVFNPDGLLLVTSTADVYQSLILAQTGDYIMQISRAQPQTTVTYTLDLQIYGEINWQRDLVRRIQFETGAVSTSVVDIVPDDNIHQYAFYAFAGQTMTLDVSGASFYLIAPDESVLALNSEQAQNVVLPITGDYRLTVYDSYTANNGYRVDLTIIGETTGIAEPQRIQFATGAISASLYDTVSGTQADEYVFWARQGQSVTLAITQGTMTLVSPTGIPVFRGDIAGGLQYINTQLPETGDYRVRVFRATGEPLIGYRLDLTIIN